MSCPWHFGFLGWWHRSLITFVNVRYSAFCIVCCLKIKDKSFARLCDFLLLRRSKNTSYLRILYIFISLTHFKNK